MTNLKARVSKLLREGRVEILETWPRDQPTRDHVDASVQDRDATHDVLYADSWTCTCGAAGCAHILAVQLVTGFRRDA